jgi:hypothetical protein
MDNGTIFTDLYNDKCHNISISDTYEFAVVASCSPDSYHVFILVCPGRGIGVPVGV